MAEQDRDQKTEQPTAQRIQRAFDEGQIGVSSEFIAGVVMMTGVLFFMLAGTWFFSSIGNTIRERSTYFDNAIMYPGSIRRLLVADVSRIGVCVLGLLVPLFVVTGLVGGLQTNFNISFKPMELKWDKLSVGKGFGRIFSSKSAVRGAMAILKASAIVLVAVLVARSQFEQIVYAGTFSFSHMIFQMCQILIYVAIAAVSIIAILGIGDLVFQKWKHIQDLKMSIRDIRDEHKESEGDPMVRARVKRLQNELSRQRMVQQVPKASVVITNPTHFAVAVEYDNETMAAPKVIAKGTEHLAKRIVEVAREHGIPIVERKPVARFLYFNVKIGQAVPQELYEAVAEILNFISRMKLGRN